MMNLSDVAQGLSTQIGKPVSWSSHGTIRLNYENRLDLILESRADFDLYFYGVLGDLPTNNAQQIYQRLLQWQLLGQAMGAASFAIDAVHGQVLIQRHVDLRATEPADLVDAIQDFFIRFDHWQTRWELPGSDDVESRSITDVSSAYSSASWIRA